MVAMAKEKLLNFSGTITEKLPNAMFKVKLENDQDILATTKGNMRKLSFKLMAGDRVDVEVTPYDLTRGRITFWHR